MTKYDNRIGAAEHRVRGSLLDPEVPECGCFRVTLRRGAPASALRIWLGFPRDPVTGVENQDRPYSWQAELNGAPVDVLDYWPACGRDGDRITREEHDRILHRNSTMDVDSPFYDPRQPIDLFTAPPPSF